MGRSRCFKQWVGGKWVAVSLLKCRDCRNFLCGGLAMRRFILPILASQPFVPVSCLCLKRRSTFVVLHGHYIDTTIMT